MDKQLFIQSNVKDSDLIERRREQILNASIQLFRAKGFHRATTREIASAAGFSIGTLYEYVRTKEDVLYLISDRIYAKVSDVFATFNQNNVTIEYLQNVITQYIRLVDEMHDEFIIMYQETKSLPKEAISYVIEKELEMVGFFERVILRCIENGELNVSNQAAYFMANEIVTIGQSWAFRKWAFSNRYSLEQFIQQQNQLFIGSLKR